MQKTDTDPEMFLDALPDEVRGDITTIDRAIQAAMAGETRVLWEGKFWGGSDQEIIGYGDHHYRNRSGNEVNWFYVGLALQKNYISVYINAVEDNAYLTEKYKDRIGKAKVGKSSISFKKLSDIDVDVLIEMVSRTREIMSGQSSDDER